MATTRIIPMHINKGKTLAQCLADRTDYAKNEEKTEQGKFISTYECDPDFVDIQFLESKKIYLQLTDRVQKNEVIAYQVRQSFKPGEITPEGANKVGYEFAMRFTKGNHAFIVCTHTDKKHIHNHVIWNSTTLDCTRKFRNFWGSTEAVRRLSDMICAEHKLSVIKNPKGHGKSYNKWLGNKEKNSNRDYLRDAIDCVLAQKPETFDDFLRLMAGEGYKAVRGKNLAFSHERQKKNIRLRSLGKGYSEEEIRSVILGEKANTPEKQKKTAEPKPSLLMDIEQKINSSKGYGYTQWAKVFKLKQMSKSLLYLQEHDFESFADLEKAADTAKDSYYELSEKIKSAEKRMAEISVLRTHIINYAKTRDVYSGYRQSGYSKKYLSEHESDITLHKSAKKAFDELGLKKLPKVKTLQAEFADLLTQKKSDYAEYRKMQKEMRELQVHKANIEYIFYPEKYENAKDVHHVQQEK